MIQKSLNIRGAENGFVVETAEMGKSAERLFPTYADAVTYVVQWLGLMPGERKMVEIIENKARETLFPHTNAEEEAREA